MRRPIIAGNWKMNKTMVEAAELVRGLLPSVKDVKNVDIVVIPPYTSLMAVRDLVRATNIGLGAQDVHWEEKGAYTGEVSPSMLKDAGVAYVVIGHSERRLYFGETNDTVNKKVKAALKAGLTPIMCVGERLDERESSKTFEVVKDNVVNGLKGIAKEEALEVVIAYEPVWAIGTGKTATPEQAEEVHAYIRKLLAGLYDKAVADGVRIQYGGSVKADNIGEIITQRDVDGALVGGASLKADEFAAIVKTSAERRA